MAKLFSYVVDHDHGLSPNPTGGYYSTPLTPTLSPRKAGERE